MFEDTFFNQAEGAAMGSPLSPIVANLFMEAFEEKALESAVLRPRMWVRYVDDTFVLWPHKEDELETNSIDTLIHNTHQSSSQWRRRAKGRSHFWMSKSRRRKESSPQEYIERTLTPTGT